MLFCPLPTLIGLRGTKKGAAVRPAQSFHSCDRLQLPRGSCELWCAGKVHAELQRQYKEQLE